MIASMCSNETANLRGPAVLIADLFRLIANSHELKPTSLH